jgi:alpha,alpha-trehalase
MLCRKISSEVEKNPEKYSLLYLPHPVIVPGGRFREVTETKEHNLTIKMD